MRWWLVVSSCIAFAGVAHAQQKPPPRSLEAASFKGDAPFTVTITGPGDFVERTKKCRMGGHSRAGAGANGLNVDWGDGSTLDVAAMTDANCAAMQSTHTYSTPGTFAVNVTAWHPGPTDGPENDWTMSATVVVTGKAGPTSLAITGPTKGQEISIENIPEPKWKLDTGQTVDLAFELVAKNGTVVTTGTQPKVSASGTGHTYMNAEAPARTALEDVLRKGITQFTIRGTASHDGKVIAKATSEVFTITPKYQALFRQLRGDDTDARQVTLEFDMYDCGKYRLEWGDGAVERGEVAFEDAAKKRCHNPNPRALFKHRYRAYGTYAVRFKHDTERLPLDKVVMYQQLDLDVKELPKNMTAEMYERSLQMRKNGCRIDKLALPKGTHVWAAAVGLVPDAGFQIDQSGYTAQKVDLDVTTPGPVALVLGSAGPKIWNIRWAPKTTIVAVVAAGQDRAVIAGLPSSTPVFMSPVTGHSPCSMVGIDEIDKPALTEVAMAAIDATIDNAVAIDKSGHATIGPATTAKLTSSPDTTVDSYRDPNAVIAGEDGVKAALASGILREPTTADFAMLQAALKKLDPPRKIGSCLATYVVTKAFVIPGGLAGGHAKCFIVPKGVASPTGYPAHSNIYDLNTDAICAGSLCFN